MAERPPPFINSYFKTQRAEKHLDELKTAVSGFMEVNSYTESIEEDSERQVYRHRVIFEQPHVWTYLIAGDVFQCLRAALDQAVWELASFAHGDPSWTQFPIFGEDNAEAKRKIKRYTKGVPDQALSVIESFQPYNRGKGESLLSNLLWQLHEVNRIDKHRRIPVRATASRIDANVVARVTPIENGCEVTVPFDVEPTFKPRFTPIVLFGDERMGVVMDVNGIERIYDFVAWTVVPRLAGCMQ